MCEQTKLTDIQRESLKSYLAEFEDQGGKIFMDIDEGVTVAVLPHFPGSAFVKLAVAYCSGTENKFRKKVGQYIVLERLRYGEYIVLPHAVAMETVYLLIGG